VVRYEGPGRFDEGLLQTFMMLSMMLRKKLDFLKFFIEIFMMTLLFILSIAVFVYLLYVLVKPEKF